MLGHFVWSLSRHLHITDLGHLEKMGHDPGPCELFQNADIHLENPLPRRDNLPVYQIQTWDVQLHRITQQIYAERQFH